MVHAQTTVQMDFIYLKINTVYNVVLIVMYAVLIVYAKLVSLHMFFINPNVTFTVLPDFITIMESVYSAKSIVKHAHPLHVYNVSHHIH